MLDLADILINSRDGNPYWTGQLSDSALATAVSAIALHTVNPSEHAQAINAGISWLLANTNSDGGWGDTTRSFSNISTTLLCWCALKKTNVEILGKDQVISAAQRWISDHCGSLAPVDIANAVYARYDNDRTFSAPIMTVCALSGVFGDGPDAWQHNVRLPFELSVFPQAFYSLLGLPVVSYALPALIAIGQVGHHYSPTRVPGLRLIRNLAVKPSLRRLKAIQPSNGGFLEAAPLTAFVTLSLAAKGLTNSIIVSRGVEFLTSSQTPDGSWPIDTNLSLWLTTLSVNALAESGRLSSLDITDRAQIAEHISNCQYKHTHPYTGSKPGGWGWTHLPGSVPDADDTSGSVLALCNLANSGLEIGPLLPSISAGCRWLLTVQNRDGGIPTFCRGWGKLPFDRSCNDITAHAVSAWVAALPHISDLKLKHKINLAVIAALNFLKQQQHFDGWWRPLWFGCQYTPDDTNEVYGTARVMAALADMPDDYLYLTRPMLEKAAHWLISAQCPNGGFSGGISQLIADSQHDLASIEETALAVLALKKAVKHLPNEKQKKTDSLNQALSRAVEYLHTRWQSESLDSLSAPIGLYFAKLWYYEKLYPLIFSTAAKI